MPLPAPIDRALDALILPSFSRIGPALRRLDPVSERLDGRRVVITGATSGIGRSAALALAELGADLVIVGRNPSKAEAVAAAADGAPDVEIADLASMVQIRELATRLRSGPPIDVLVNNAGALFPDRGVTEEGIERTLATNLAGHYLLTTLLADHITDGGRIINVSSGGAYTQRISPSMLELGGSPSEGGGLVYDGAVLYAQTKRGQLILTERWAAEFAERHIDVNAMHPGWANTPGVEGSLPGFFRYMRPLLRTPEEGADTIVWLAASPDAAGQTGRYFLDRVPRSFHKIGRTRETAEQRQQLFDLLAALTGV